MDPILFPYEYKVKTQLIQKKQINDKAHLVLEDNLASNENEFFQDQAYIDGQKVEKVYTNNNTTYYVVKGMKGKKTYDLEINKDLRQKNMASYTCQRIISLICHKVFSLSLIKVEGRDLYFSCPSHVDLDQLEEAIQKSLDKLIAACLDIEVYKKNESYFMKVPSLATSRISYPVFANTGELRKIQISLSQVDQDLKISYLSYEDLEKDYQETKSSIKDLEGLSQKEGLDEKFQDLLESYKTSKNQAKELREAYYRLYLKTRPKTHIGESSVLIDTVEETLLDLDWLANMDGSDVRIFVKEENNLIIFSAGSKELIDLEELLMPIGKIYNIQIKNEDKLIKGTFDRVYKDNFIHMLSRDLRSKLGKEKKDG